MLSKCANDSPCLRKGTNKRKRRGCFVRVMLKMHQRNACRSCLGVYSGLTQPNCVQRCLSALPRESNCASSLNVEKKCSKISKAKSSGEAKHSTVRCKCSATIASKVVGVRQCWFER